MHEITRLRAQHAASKEAAAQPSFKAKKTVHREKVSKPGAIALAEDRELHHEQEGELSDTKDHPA